MVELLEFARKAHIGTIAWLAFLGMLIGFGVVPALFPGFARRDSIVTLVAGQIAELKDKECNLPKGQRNAYSQRILLLSEECDKMGGGQVCSIPACEDL